jgi:hypothetical protein
LKNKAKKYFWEVICRRIHRQKATPLEIIGFFRLIGSKKIRYLSPVTLAASVRRTDSECPRKSYIVPPRGSIFHLTRKNPS